MLGGLAAGRGESKAQSPTEAAPSGRATDTREVLGAVFGEGEADGCETIGLGDRYVGGPVVGSAVGPMEVRSSGGVTEAREACGQRLICQWSKPVGQG